MKKYVCKNCGRACYSAVDAVKYMQNPYCPYCGSEIADAKNGDPDEVKI